MSTDTAKLHAAITAAGVPADMHKDVFQRIDGSLSLYHAGGYVPPWRASSARRGPKRDERLEALLIDVAVQFHVANPDRPGVTKRGDTYGGALVEFTQDVLDSSGIRPKTRSLGRLIYSVVRKEAQIHGDLKKYPPLAKRSRATWKLSTDERVPDDPVELIRLYGARRRRQA